MSKITKKNLTRGVKLSVQHFNEPMSAIESNLNNATVGPDNLQLNNANFSLFFNWPRLPAYAFAEQEPDDDKMLIAVPFLLPPLQDQWTDNIVGSSTPMPILRSMSIGFDTGMGPNGIFDTWDDGATPADSEYCNDAANVYDMTLEIRDKEQAIVYGTSADVIYNSCRNTIYSGSLPSNLFTGAVQRFNPVFIDGIDKVIDPLKTYMLYINFPHIWAGKTISGFAHKFCISSLSVKLNFEGPLVTRDVYDAQSYPIQNIPSFNDGTQQGSFLALDTATSASFITARTGVTGSGRIQRNAELLDAGLLSGLKAGRNVHGTQPITESLSHAAAYTCFAVPMFGGWNDIRAQDINQIGLPYGSQIASGTVTPWDGYLSDRRIIPIAQPFVIHHVFAVHNYYSHFLTGTSNYPYYNENPRLNGPGGLGSWFSGFVPSNANFTSSVGVGICTALASDNKQYDQVAYASFTPGDKVNYVVDRIKSGKFANAFGAGTAVGQNYDFEIMQIPLVSSASDGGAGTRAYINQGYPFYVGRGDMSTRSRRPVYTVTGSSGNPFCGGGEQFLEVRWKMEDSDGLNDGAGRDSRTTYVGMGGNWVFIIGKTEVATTNL